MAQSYIALGGNLGNVEQTFDNALQTLQLHPRIEIKQVSSVHRTSPVGEQVGNQFFNSVAELDTTLPPLLLLDHLLSVENRFGRTREIHWGPRTLDLDLLLYGQEILDTPRLRLPHPGCWYRRFVLDPWVEIAADVLHPVKRATISQLRQRLLVRPFRLALAGADEGSRNDLIRTLSDDFPEVQFSHYDWENTLADEDLPTLIAWLCSPPQKNSSQETFDQLPLLPRIDISSFSKHTHNTLRDILNSALSTN